MLWAIVENEKIAPIPNTNGTCPSCEGKVFSKCGEVNVWHWAHFKDESCDSWYEPETFWHLHWKMTFGKDHSEIGITKDDKTHIADILTEENVVIELQNSPIQKPVIKQREEFYGEKMIWLINGAAFRSNLIVKDFWADQDYLELKSLPRQPVRWTRCSPEIKKGTDGELFEWKYPRRSWEGVRRPVFIDLGEDSLFWVKEGMGTFQIRGTYVAKEKFIKKYRGDYDYYINKSSK